MQGIVEEAVAARPPRFSTAASYISLPYKCCLASVPLLPSPLNSSSTSRRRHIYRSPASSIRCRPAGVTAHPAPSGGRRRSRREVADDPSHGGQHLPCTPPLIPRTTSETAWVIYIRYDTTRRGREKVGEDISIEMWPKLRSFSHLPAESGFKSIRPGRSASSPEQQRHSGSSSSSSSSMPSTVNVNEEYRKALRTKSYVEVCTRINGLFRRSATHPSTTSPPPPPPRQPQTPSRSTRQEEDYFSSSSSSSCTSPLALTPTRSPLSSSPSPFLSAYSDIRDGVLEPGNQEALLGAVRDPGVYALLVDYFDASAEACNICSSLLGSIHQLRRDQRRVQRLLSHTIAAGCASPGDCADLVSYVELQNPLSSLQTVHFHRIHGLYESLIRRLILARDGIMRRVRLVRVLRRAAGITLVAACSLAAAAVLVVAAHAVVSLAVAAGPVVAAGPFSAWFRRRAVGGRVRTEKKLARLGAQVDAAARGAYILSRDMETMSRMVTRLHDEVEHGKDVVRLFLRSRERWVLSEAAAAARGGGGGFVELLEELEEHIYWCLLTNKRARGMVAQEIYLKAHER